MLLANKQVAIIGGGPGGLTLGRLLQQQGVNVKVYERDKDRYVRQQGSTLDMHTDTGLKAITAAGLLDEFKKQYRPGADRVVVVNSQLEVLLDEHDDKNEKNFGDEHFRPEIDRGALRDMLIASLKEDNIVWNARFSAMTPDGTGWNIQFENGTSVYADLVIAADGANSKLRKYITDIPPVYSGVTAIEGNIQNAVVNAPKFWQLAKGGSLFALENGRTILFITKGDGTLAFLIGLKVAESWLANLGIDITNRASLAAWFKQEFASWHPEWNELLAADTLTIVPRPWYHFPTDQRWKPLSNLTIMGDAAHRMPAYAGEGANQALADALDLYEALCGDTFETIGQAIAAYEEKMCTRAGAITEMTLHFTAGFHEADNLQFFMEQFGGK
ncbi:2-polyprenyl-6-methoxyphenol hydroxylase [Niastella vici]|uniref:2-polyprenyl-6-methoxyphenol hydroxylase n=1 Tax=Niastella vici TaxID=1703345 RepID=A0A1V9FEL1_9BACT|nr:FAD-dependent monooxygenase [Niastella vici]OQP56799.1 2-polyprenyl-6-methoxyphenol hydroxylase [Niastella vici]